MEQFWLTVLVVAILWLVFRFVRNRFQPQQPSETVDDVDPFAGVRSPKKRGPQNRAGAVALAEPDEKNHQFPPRTV